jgi:hypothetical protein
VQLVESVDILCFPEILFEFVDLAPGRADLGREADDDRPGPDAGEQQTGHDDLDDDVGMQQQRER